MTAVLRFTVGQRTISGRFDHVTDHFAPWSDKMAGRKRASSLSESTSSDGAPASKRRMLLAKSVDKWIAEYDKELNTSTWLKYTVVDRHHVDSLTCSVCTRFKSKLEGMRNYNPAFIEGSKNLRTSSFKDHAASSMHVRAMSMFKKQRGDDVTEYAPIAKALLTMDESSQVTLKRKFDIAYFIAKEKLSFTKMKPLCDLQERHGVDLGARYKNDDACATFVSYIAKEQQHNLLETLSEVNFFSIQADGSTDSGNVEDELYTVQYFNPKTEDGQVHVCNNFFTVRQVKRGDARGLFECFKAAMEFVGVTNWEEKLIGVGCDGTNVNIAAGGLRGYLEEAVPWIVVFWCLAHRLELSLKDALANTFFSTIDDMLMRVYYLYEKSPKKCVELAEVVDELRQCLEDGDMPNRGNRPLRACGTRFVAHKVAALGCLIDRYGAYLAHLTALIEDPHVKSVDREKLRGYVRKWRDSKMLLKPCAILCKVLQEDEVCVVGAIESLLKTKRNLDNLKTTTFENLPVVKKVINRIKREDGIVMYQQAEITNYEGAVAFLRSHQAEYMEAVQDCLRDRVKLQHTDVLTHSLTILATYGWEKGEDGSFAHDALESLSTRFRVPLEKAGVDCSLIQEEWEDILDYAKRYLNLVQENYTTIWWKLFNAVDASKWQNILRVVELLFCLPLTNGRLERLFSQLKLIKSDRRSSLGENRLDQLLRITVDAPPLSKWDASGAVQLWWEDKTRRPQTKGTQKVTQNRTKSGPSTSSDASTSTVDDDTDTQLSDCLALDDWEAWLS